MKRDSSDVFLVFGKINLYFSCDCNYLKRRRDGMSECVKALFSMGPGLPSSWCRLQGWMSGSVPVRRRCGGIRTCARRGRRSRGGGRPLSQLTSCPAGAQPDPPSTSQPWRRRGPERSQRPIERKYVQRSMKNILSTISSNQ